MIQIQNLAPYWWTPESERDAKNPVRFRLKPLTALERMEVFEGTMLTSAANGTKRIEMPRDAMRLLIRYGVTAWENVTGEGGHPVPFSAAQPDRSVEQLPGHVVDELLAELLRRASMTDEEKKTS